MKRITSFRKDLEAKKAVKIIAGIDNFDIERVRNVVIAADKAGASAVDVAAKEEIIKMAKETTSLPVFVSSIVPQDLAMAVKAGADAIEVGNFDALYKKGLRMSAEEILDIVKETLSLIGNSSVFVCVTIPGHIDIASQIALAKELEELNIDLIQTEGAATVHTTAEGARALLETAQVSIANTIELVRKYYNRNLTIEGAVLTMYDARTNLSNQVVKEVNRYFENRVFETVIPRNVRLSEAPSYGLPIVLYDPMSKGARSYEKLVKEIIKKNK